MTNNKKKKVVKETKKKQISFNYKYVLLVLLLSLFIPSFYKVNKKVTEKVQDIIEEVIYIPSSPEIETTDEGWTTETVVKIKKDAASRHGISYYEYCVREDEDFSKCEWQKTDTKNIIVSKTGIYNVVFRAVNSKNKHSKLSNVIKVYIDNEAPEITSDSLKLRIFDTKVDVSINAADKNSGLGEITYSLDGTNFELLDPINGIMGLKPNTEYDLYIKVSDKLGNSKVLKKTLKTTKKGALPIDEAGNEITDDPSVNPGTDNKPEEIDDFIPEISLSDVPTNMDYGESYVLPTSYKFGKSGGVVTCSYEEGKNVENTSELPVGPLTITCEAKGNNGLTTIAEKEIMVNPLEAKEEVWDGYILLNLFYPSRSTDRQWRLNNKDVTRTGDNNTEWTDYTGPIMVRVEDVSNILIKYKLDNKEKIDTKGEALVDIRPNSYRVYSFDNTKVEIVFDENADTKEYSLDGGNTWNDYTGPFFIGPNTLIDAKVTKTINTYDKSGDLIHSKKVTNTDSVYISEKAWKTEDIFGKVDINIQTSPNSVSLDETSLVTITYQSDSENRRYRLNGGAWQKYNEGDEIRVGKNTLIEAYATATREVTKSDGTKYSGQTDGSASAYVYDNTDYHDYRVSLSGNTNIDVTETSKIYVSTDNNLKSLSYSIDGGEFVSTTATSRSRYQIATLRTNQNITVEAVYENNDNVEITKYDSLTVGEDKNSLRLSITTPDNIIDNTLTDVSIYANYPTDKLEYSLDKGTTWIPYEGTFKVSNDTLVMARAEKTNSDGTKQTPTISKFIATTPLKVDVKTGSYIYNWSGVNYLYVDQYVDIVISSNYPNATLKYSYDNQNWTTYHNSFKVKGNNTIYAKAEYTDKYGTLKTATGKLVTALRNDLNGPTISLSRNTASLNPVEVTITTAFPGDIYYMIDNGTPSIYHGPFTIDKNSTVKAYYVREEDGLKSKTNSLYVDIIRDPSLPQITFEVTPSDPRTSSELVDGCVTVKINYTYANSKEYRYNNNYFNSTYTGPLQVCSNKTIIATAKNANGSTTETLIINNVKPQVPVTLSSNITINPNGQNSSNSITEVTVSMQFDETATKKQYYIGKQGPYDYVEPFTVNKNTTIYLYQEDNKGNTGSNSKRIDFLPSGITDPVITSNPDNNTQSSMDEISIAYDESATVKRYRINNGQLQDYTGPFTVRSNNTTIYAYSKNADDEEAEATYLVTNIVTSSSSNTGGSGSDEGTPATNPVLIEQDGYYLIKLNYPNTSDPKHREYKYGEDGEWKTYPSDGILLIKPEYEEQILKDGVLQISIKDENGNTISFNGDYYIIDDVIAKLIANIFIRWETSTPRTPVFEPSTTNWVSELDMDIDYPTDMEEYLYKIVYSDGTTTGWKDYKGTFTIKEPGATIYAKCVNELEVESEIAEFNVTNIDKTKPTISNTELTQAGTNFLTFNVTAADNESGVKYYYYSTDGESYSVAMNKTIKFNGLTANTEYTLYFYVQDNVGNRSEVVTATGTTSQIAKPIVTFEPSADTWSTSKRVLISHEDTLMTLYYSKDNGSSWEEYTEEVVLTENGSIVAKASDGTNESISDTYNITKIDTTAPTVNNIAYAGRSSRLIVNAEASDSESGIDHFLYSLDGITYTEDDESYSFTNLKANTDYTVYVKAVNKAGLESEVRSTSAHTNDIAEISYSVTDADVWAYTKTVTINYPTEEDGTYTNQYSLNGGNTWVNYTEPILIETENTSIVARVLDGTQNTKVASTLQIAKIDRTEPTISLDGVPSEFETGSSVTIPTSYTVDNNKSGGTVVCTSSKSGEFTKVSDLEGGYQTITCTVTTGAGRTATASKSVTVVKLESRRGESILDILNDNTLQNDHYYSFIVEASEETETYSVHMIVLDGNQTITEDTRYGDLGDCASGTTEDLMAKRMVIVKVNGDYTINEGVTVGPTYNEQYGGPKGFLLYVTGKLTNNGTIDQSHGAYARGDNVYLWKNALTNDYEIIPAVGGAGGVNNSELGQNGSEVSKRSLGGGSAGGSRFYSTYSGGSGTSYSGGTGGTAYSLTAEASSYGGTGGEGYIGGAGNPGGYGSTGSGLSGTGGLLMIYSDEFENNGTIISKGNVGAYNGGVSSGGGSSGGGSINIFTNQATNANLTTNINDKYDRIIGNNNVIGGAPSGQYSGAGGSGTVNIGEIRNGQYYDLKEIIQQDINIYAESIAKSGESIIDILNDNPDLTEGYWNFKVATSEETVVYPVHLIVLDGNQTIAENTRYGSLDDCASGTTEDKMATSMVIVKVNGDYTINEGITVGPVYHEQYGGPKGFMLYVTGKLINNGTIDQSHGAYAHGDNVYLWKNALTNDYEMIPAITGAGGVNKGDAGQNGLVVSNRSLGGGSSGGSRFSSGYAGGSGTSYSGGTGGAAYSLTSEASPYGGTGGAGYIGGAGNPGGYGSTGTGSNGTGGLLIIYSNEYENNGAITSRGNVGIYNGGVSSCSGASGGGSINIFTNQTTNANLTTKISDKYNRILGTSDVTGGAATCQYGGAGGSGTVSIGEIRNGQYYDLKEIIQQDINTYSESIVKSGESIIGILNDNPDLTEGYWNFKVITDEETIVYPVHLIVLDGNQIINENTRYGSLEDCASGTTEEQMATAMVIVKVNGDYTINEGVTVGPVYHGQYGGPKGFILYVTGKLTNNGTIDQKHGANAAGENVYLWKNELTNDYEMIPAVGGIGGINKGEYGQNGSEVSKRALGGGGAAGSRYYSIESGTTATSYSGGSGGSASDRSGVVGGAGNPGGIGMINGSNGTGGLLVIYTNEFVNTGSILAIGATGAYYSSTPSGGGSSGGGSINIFTNQNTNVNQATDVDDKYNSILGSTNAAGGYLKTTYGVTWGGAGGGAGTVNIGGIRNGQYYDLKEIIQQDREISLDESGLTIDYTGSENIIRVTKSGTYKIEAWGAQGADATSTYTGGYGGYTTAVVNLESGQGLDVVVGGEGGNYEYVAGNSYLATGGYNGGGNGATPVSSNWPYRYMFGGGGATHVATSSLQYDTLASFGDATTANNYVYLVAGGGGAGSSQTDGNNLSHTKGGSGGGTTGGNIIVVSRNLSSITSNGGTQTGCGSSSVSNNNCGFGSGFSVSAYNPYQGGGGGWYGGGAGAGGSGYINDNLVSTGHMTCYNCMSQSDTQTTVNDCHSRTATADCAKEGNGYVKITYVGSASPKSAPKSALKSAPKVIVENPNFTIDNTNYAESKTISISYPKGYTSEYSLDLGKTWIEYQGEITVEENITILARSLDENNSVVSTSSFTVNRIDRETPSIELNLDDEITVGSDITLPTGYTSTKSGVTYECKYNDIVISNINELSVGDYEITCDIENGLGKKNTISKIIKIIEEISKEEVSEAS